MTFATAERIRMRGALQLQSIIVDCIIGVHPHERITPQKITLDIEIEVDFLCCVGKKDTSGTVDWSALPRELSPFLIQQQYYLAEDACVGLVKKILTHPAARWAKVALTKSEAKTGAASVRAVFEARNGEI